MNPLLVIAMAAMGVVGTAALSALPPDSEDPTTFTATPDPWSDIVLYEAPQTTIGAPQTSEPAPVGYCPQIVPLALSEGFSEAEAALLSRIAWHESRCQTGIVGDLNVGESYGILQIYTNTWCEPSRYWPDGYLQAALVLEECSELFDPATAVRAARAIYLAGGFEQWTTYAKAVNS